MPPGRIYCSGCSLLTEKSGEQRHQGGSLAETARRNGARPYYYFKYLLERAAVLQKQHENDPITELKYLDPMMPWSEEYKKYERSEIENDNQILRQLVAGKTTKSTENANAS